MRKFELLSGSTIHVNKNDLWRDSFRRELRNTFKEYLNEAESNPDLARLARGIRRHCEKSESGYDDLIGSYQMCGCDDESKVVKYFWRACDQDEGQLRIISMDYYVDKSKCRPLLIEELIPLMQEQCLFKFDGSLWSIKTLWVDIEIRMWTIIFKYECDAGPCD